jgi:hypothetical protein
VKAFCIQKKLPGLVCRLMLAVRRHIPIECQRMRASELDERGKCMIYEASCRFDDSFLLATFCTIYFEIMSYQHNSAAHAAADDQVSLQKSIQSSY